MYINFSKNYNWQKLEIGKWICHFIGNKKFQDELTLLLNSDWKVNTITLMEFWKNQTENFCAVLENDHSIISFVDPIKGYPLYYYYDGREFAISDSARVLKKQFEFQGLNNISLLEFMTSGFVTGKETLYHNLYQIQAGEMIKLDKKLKTLSRERYYRYIPTEKSDGKIEDYLFQLNEIINKAFGRVIESAEDRPIWVPLSGGLDSRLNVCKLVEMGYENIHTFSYGPKLSKNHEAQTAREISKVLNIPWTFIPHNPKKSRDFFQSTLRKKYWEFSDNYSAKPNMQDIEHLFYLRENKIISEDAIIVNGQSGDFITGGHIPSNLINGNLTSEDIFSTIIEKHFSIWNYVNKDQILRNILRDKFFKLLNITPQQNLSYEELISLYESWEWQERQAKVVASGQRAYDCLDIEWRLPHWDFEYMSFWSTVPLNLRKNQSLYKMYLKKYDYKELFNDFIGKVKPGYSGLNAYLKRNILGLLNLLHVNTKPLVKYTSYFGYYHNYYSYFSFLYFLNNIKRAQIPPEGRGVFALVISKWLQENNFPNVSSYIENIEN
mgnify:CR=1 FL=1